MSTVTRGLGVLEVLAGMRQPAPLGAIARRVRLSESQTFRVLQTLVDEGYVDHFGRSGYRVGSRALALSTVIGPRPELFRLVFPSITRLATRVGATVTLHLRSGAQRVLVLGVPDPTGPMTEPAGSLGERSGLSVGASGRVILAHLPREEARELAPSLPAKTLALIAERGYDVSLGENHAGINGVSAPLLVTDARLGREVPLGSVSLSGPEGRFDADHLVGLAPQLVGTCQELAPRLARLLGPHASASVAALDL